ncbi:hypothetical protein Hrd1104_11840 [Halorhabdus sp. CBA1104]|nr:hypothetical protein Hrd1104_11840 [Halorhabdus sp. CBA1104]
MSTLNQPASQKDSTWHLLTIGAVLVVASLGLSSWLLSNGDIPGGLGTLLLTIAGSLFIAIGNAESPPQGA